MKELNKFRQFLNENKEPINEVTIDDILAQIEDMAFKGKLGSGQEGVMTRDELAKAVVAAIRKGRSRFDKSQPDYADRMAARKEKAAATKAADAERMEKYGKEIDARYAKEKAEREARIANNQLPLRMYTEFTDIKSNLGPLLAYYNDFGNAIELKDRFKDTSFAPEVAQAVWKGQKYRGGNVGGALDKAKQTFDDAKNSYEDQITQTASLKENDDVLDEIIKEGTWSLGGPKEIDSIIKGLQGIIKMADDAQTKRNAAGRGFVNALQNQLKSDGWFDRLYKIVGDDSFFDHYDAANTAAQVRDFDKVKNHLGDAIARAEELKAAIMKNSGIKENDSVLDEIINNNGTI